MRFAGKDRIGVANGEITVAFRRWAQPRVIAGRDYRTNGGRVLVDAVDRIAPSKVTGKDARAAGRPNAAAVRDDDRGDPSLPLYRVRFHLVTDDDPRELLAADDALSPDDLAEISRRLQRYDEASSHGACTSEPLRMIAAQPARRAPEVRRIWLGWTQPTPAERYMHRERHGDLGMSVQECLQTFDSVEHLPGIDAVPERLVERLSTAVVAIRRPLHPAAAQLAGNLDQAVQDR